MKTVTCITIQDQSQNRLKFEGNRTFIQFFPGEVASPIQVSLFVQNICVELALWVQADRIDKDH